MITKLIVERKENGWTVEDGDYRPYEQGTGRPRPPTKVWVAHTAVELATIIATVSRENAA